MRRDGGGDAHRSELPGRAGRASLVEAISDECDALNSLWIAGLRGMPELLAASDGVLSIRSVDNGDDAYPSAEDMTSTYAGPIGRARRSGRPEHHRVDLAAAV